MLLSRAYDSAAEPAGAWRVRLGQLANTPYPIFVTLPGIVIDVIPVQPSKAELPISVTLLGIVIDVRPVHPEKAELPIFVTLFGIVIDVIPIQS